MTLSEFSLSTEELALALSLVGKPAIGRSLMTSQLGQIGDDEAQARLKAAGHSLMARGWLAVGIEKPILNPALAGVMAVITNPDFSILYSRANPEAEFTLAYHFGDQTILEHRLEQGVVHHIAEVSDTATVIKGGLAFFGLPQAQSFSCMPIQLPYDVLKELKDVDDPVAVDRRLQQAGVAYEARSLLPEDIAHPRYRGSTLRVQYDAQGAPFSEAGFLLLHGPERLWLITLSGKEQMTATIMPATVQTFHQELSALL